MNDTKKEVPPISLLKELDSAAYTAAHYGFTAVASPRISDDDKAKAKQVKHYDRRIGESEENIALLRSYQDQAFIKLGQPPMIWTKRPFPGSDARKKTGTETAGVDILNSPVPAADALIIRTIVAMLEDLGAKDIEVEINCVGDKDSFARFERELTNHVRKHLSTLSAEWREKAKTDMFSLLSAEDKTLVDIMACGPRPLSFLTEASRLHFKQVLEFLESAAVSYRINQNLIPHGSYGSHTVFEVRGRFGSETTVLGWGSRYNTLSKKLGLKKEIPAVGGTIVYPKKSVSKPVLVEKMKPTRFYLIQLGNLARLQALPIIDLLRHEHIRVHHALTRENVSSQMASAEYLRVSHLLIIGQKEAIEQSVVVRSTDVRDQETVKIIDLPLYLKRIIKEGH